MGWIRNIMQDRGLIEKEICGIEFEDLQKLCRHRNMNADTCGISTSVCKCEAYRCPFVDVMRVVVKEGEK
jgi:hypothetical protein